MMRAKKGFTLVEILIVVVILGILAAIVIPQFTNASEEAKESRLAQDLQSVRAQIELYKLNHNGDLPGQGGGTANTFVLAMTGFTDQFGDTQTTSGVGVFGPYLQKIPTNPFVDVNVAQAVTEGTASTNAASPGDDSSGWYFNTADGFFHANDSTNNHNTW